MIGNSHIFTIDGHEDFFDSLSKGIIEKVYKNSNIKNVIILLPTKHSCTSLNNLFAKLGYQNNIPKILSIGDLSNVVSLPSPKIILSRMNLILKINEIIKSKNLPIFNNLSPITQASEYLANLIYTLELYQINLDTILKIIDDNLSLYQQELLQLSKIVLEEWKRSPYITKAGYNNLLLEHLTKNTTNKIVIMAGITSTLPPILKLMKKIVLAKNGFIVFYGVDQNLSKEDWLNLEATHPQYKLKQLFNYLSINYADIKDWSTHSKTQMNYSWLTQALKPAKSCLSWHNSESFLINNWNYLECLDQHQETKAIIDIIKHNQNKSSILIITPDESLMIKLILALKANNIQANIVRDHPLSKTNTAIWLNLCLNFIKDDFSILISLAMLKHNLAKINADLIVQIELLVRDKQYLHKNILKVKIEDENFASFVEESQKISKILSYSNLNFSDILDAHLEFAEKIAKESIWQTIENEELKKYLDQLKEFSKSLGCVSLNEYSQLFNYFLNTAYYRHASTDHSITIAKPIDARLHKAELMILAGMNETVWPSQHKIDPFLHSNLIKTTNLPSYEENIGEEAYDFFCLAQAKQVIITRSEKQAGNITIPSRWLMRILTFTQKIGIDIKTYHKSTPKSEPPVVENFTTAPIPHLKYRPIQLSVTQIDKLIFNPYHIYVDLILKLKKLPELSQELSSLDFGIFVHRSLELYNRSAKKELMQRSLEALLESGRQVLLELNLGYDQLELIYWSRFIRIARWYIANENHNHKIHLEAPGRLKLADNFTLTARADRIEISQDNKIHIIDYKTGRLSSLKSIFSGQNLQLLLEGIIARNGGFYFQKSPQKLGSLTYIQLSGGEPPVETLEIDIESIPKQLEKLQLIDHTEQYLNELIEEYQNPITPYHYTNKKKQGYCEYAHLSRIFD